MLLLALGAAVNVVVAWGCELWSEELIVEQVSNRQTDDILREFASQWLAEPYGFVTGNRAKSCGIHRIMAVGADQQSNTAGVHQHSAGWPMLSLYGSIVFIIVDDDSSRVSRAAIPLSQELHGWFGIQPTVLLPYGIAFPGFVINTLFYAAMCWLVLFAPFALRRLLRRRGRRCVACGYPIGSSEVCTECGTRL